MAGNFYASLGLGERAVIFVNTPDDVNLDAWKRENRVFTKWLEKKHPLAGNNAPILYPKSSLIDNLSDGDLVVATIEVRKDKRGNGMKCTNVVKVLP